MHQFEITPKMERRSNGTLLTPKMKVFVTTNLSNPFNNGAKEVIYEYDRVWKFDYKRAGATMNWFNVERVD